MSIQGVQLITDTRYTRGKGKKQTTTTATKMQYVKKLLNKKLLEKKKRKKQYIKDENAKIKEIKTEQDILEGENDGKSIRTNSKTQKSKRKIKFSKTNQKDIILQMDTINNQEIRNKEDSKKQKLVHCLKIEAEMNSTPQKKDKTRAVLQKLVGNINVGKLKCSPSKDFSPADEFYGFTNEDIVVDVNKIRNLEEKMSFSRCNSLIYQRPNNSTINLTEILSVPIQNNELDDTDWNTEIESQMKKCDALTTDLYKKTGVYACENNKYNNSELNRTVIKIINHDPLSRETQIKFSNIINSFDKIQKVVKKAVKSNYKNSIMLRQTSFIMNYHKDVSNSSNVVEEKEQKIFKDSSTTLRKLKFGKQKVTIPLLSDNNSEQTPISTSQSTMNKKHIVLFSEEDILKSKTVSWKFVKKTMNDETSKLIDTTVEKETAKGENIEKDSIKVRRNIKDKEQMKHSLSENVKFLKKNEMEIENAVDFLLNSSSNFEFVRNNDLDYNLEEDDDLLDVDIEKLNNDDCELINNKNEGNYSHRIKIVDNIIDNHNIAAEVTISAPLRQPLILNEDNFIPINFENKIFTEDYDNKQILPTSFKECQKQILLDDKISAKKFRNNSENDKIYDFGKNSEITSFNGCAKNDQQKSNSSDQLKIASQNNMMIYSNDANENQLFKECSLIYKEVQGKEINQVEIEHASFAKKEVQNNNEVVQINETLNTMVLNNETQLISVSAEQNNKTLSQLNQPKRRNRETLPAVMKNKLSIKSSPKTHHKHAKLSVSSLLLKESSSSLLLLRTKNFERETITPQLDDLENTKQNICILGKKFDVNKYCKRNFNVKSRVTRTQSAQFEIDDSVSKKWNKRKRTVSEILNPQKKSKSIGLIQQKRVKKNDKSINTSGNKKENEIIVSDSKIVHGSRDLSKKQILSPREFFPPNFVLETTNNINNNIEESTLSTCEIIKTINTECESGQKEATFDECNENLLPRSAARFCNFDVFLNKESRKEEQGKRMSVEDAEKELTLIEENLKCLGEGTNNNYENLNETKNCQNNSSFLFINNELDGMSHSINSENENEDFLFSKEFNVNCEDMLSEVSKILPNISKDENSNKNNETIRKKLTASPSFMQEKNRKIIAASKEYIKKEIEKIGIQLSIKYDDHIIASKDKKNLEVIDSFNNNFDAILISSRLQNNDKSDNVKLENKRVIETEIRYKKKNHEKINKKGRIKFNQKKGQFVKNKEFKICSSNYISLESKRRGRKPRIKSVENSDSTLDATDTKKNNNHISDINHVKTPCNFMKNEKKSLQNEISLKEKKRRGRPRSNSNFLKKIQEGTNYHTDKLNSKVAISENSVVDNITQITIKENNTSLSERKLHPRLLLVKNRNDLLNDPPKNSEGNKQLNVNDIRCGFCKKITTKKEWIKHLSTHGGIGWIEKMEKPIDVESFRECVQASIRYFKQYKVKSLKCNLCGNVFKSGLGLIGHVEICNITDEEKQKQTVECTYCHKKYISLSALRSHQKYSCTVLHAKNKVEANIKQDQGPKKELFTNSGRFKRKSVIKAEKRFAENLDENSTEEKYTISYKPITGRALVWKFQLQMNHRGTAKCVSHACDFKTSNLDEILEHNNSCEKVPRGGFVCSACTFHNNDKNEVIRHYKCVHIREKQHQQQLEQEKNDSKTCVSDSDVELDLQASANEDSNSDNILSLDSDRSRTNKTKMKRKKNKNNKYLPEDNITWKQLIVPEENLGEQKLYWKRTLQFRKSNFSEHPLFTFASPVIGKVQNPIISYIPKTFYSMKFSFNQKSKINKQFGSNYSQDNWKQIEKFSPIHMNNEKLIFVGGSVSSVSWIPTINNVESQYLVISCKKDIYKYAKCGGDIQFQQALITVYEIDNIKEFETEKCMPKFLYGIPFDTGPINYIEFLPSGGYSKKLNRLGLMAVASLKSDIHIYSLPLKASKDFDITNVSNNVNVNNVKDSINSNLFINLKPVITLKLNLRKIHNKTQLDSKFFKESPCTKICWTKNKGHNIIVSAYTNGFVAIWNIEEDNNLNRFMIAGIRNFVPVCYFQPTTEIITGLDIHYDMNNARWLLISTRWKDNVIYDIKDFGFPQIITEDSELITINHSLWPIIWENPIYSGSQDVFKNSGFLNSLSPLGINYNYCKLLKTSAEIITFDFNSWYNACIIGSANGDLLINYLTILNLNLEAKSKAEKKLCLLCTDLIRLDGKSMENDINNIGEYELFNQKNYQKYGLIFSKSISCDNLECATDVARCSPFWLNTFLKINKVACNNNEAANKLIAVGYENGLLRIVHL